MFLPIFHHCNEDRPLYEQSFIPVPKATVLEQCQKVIDNINEYNAQRKSAYVKRYMKKLNSGWWHRFRKKPDYTIETTEDRIKEEIKADEGQWRGRHDWGTDYHPSHGHKWLGIALSIKKLAEASDEDVRMTAEDWDVLTGSWSV